MNGGAVLVTGAGQGIGRETARLLARQGRAVVALGRQPAPLAALRDEIGCEVVCCDLADAERSRRAVAAAVEAAADRDRPVDGLVNCAGIVRLSRVIDTTVAEMTEVLAVNTIAPLVLAQAFAAPLIAAGRSGVIVNVSSLAARVGTPLHAAYCASKAALDALTRVMACELGPQGIRVNGVNPVVTLTPMGQQAWADPARASPMLARIPLGRFAEATEVAAVIAFLLGPESTMVNGVSLDVDGGFRAG